MIKPRPRCLLADDHPALVAAVSSFLEAEGFDVMTASDGAEALAVAESEQPDLAVVDFRMPALSGPALLARLVDVSPGTRTAVYTADADRALLEQALAAGARAVVLKEAPLADLVRALKELLLGRAYVDPALAAAGLAATHDPAGSLTQRELEVLRLLADGLQHDEIGRELGISAETVRTHVRKASARLGASTRTQAVASALRLRLIA